jgi:DNA/RNA endonuclease YhcR with UshA esterase domain
MKRLPQYLAAVALLCFSVPLHAGEPSGAAQKKISAEEADKHYDENLTVTGKVAQVTIRSKVVFLNLDQAFPNSPFTGVIFSANTNQFGDLKKLNGKDVEITGKVKKYNDRPEIVLNGTNQLRIVEQPIEPKR